MKARKIKTKLDDEKSQVRGNMSGWLDGKGTYLWFGDKDDKFIGTLSGQRLYRLAKAIVTQFEKGG